MFIFEAVIAKNVDGLHSSLTIFVIPQFRLFLDTTSPGIAKGSCQSCLSCQSFRHYIIPLGFFHILIKSKPIANGAPSPVGMDPSDTYAIFNGLGKNRALIMRWS